MEGSIDRPLPEVKKKKGSNRTKLTAVVIVIALIIASLALGTSLTSKDEGPSAALSADKAVITAGSSVIFNASASADGKGTINEYIWNFGDGSVETSTSPEMSHTYNYPGKYLVLLTVSDDKGNNDSNWNSLLKIEVDNPDAPSSPTNDTAPIAVVVAGSDTVSSGTSVPIDASSSLGYSVEDGVAGAEVSYISNYTWTFGDGSAVAYGNLTQAGTVSHAYTGNGVVYVSYVTLTSIHNATQRYYFDVAILPSAGTSGKVYTFVEETAAGNDPDTLDPAIDYESSGEEVIQNVYETLVWYNGSSVSDLVPMLASEVPTVANGGISADGLNYTFHLRSGVCFQNGELMTAEDVVYSLQRVLIINDPNGPAWMLGQVLLPSYQVGGAVNLTELNNTIYALDSSTVVIKLCKPYAAFLEIMACTVCSIISKKFVEEHGGTQSLAENDYLKYHTCGTGPYKLVVWSQGEKIVLSRNDNYWRTPASIQVIQIKQVADFNTRLMHLESGDADSIYVPRSNIDSLAGVDNIRISKNNKTLTLDFIAMNENIASSSLDIGNIPSDFFSDVNIRKAFVSAFDYTEYLEVALKGTGVEPNGPIAYGLLGYDASVPTYTFNLTQAKAYLMNAINPATGDSWYQDGFTVTIYYSTDRAVWLTACEILKAGLEAISDKITVNIQSLSWQTYLGYLYSSELPVFVLGWEPDYADADDYAIPLCHENGTYPSILSISNSDLTALVDEAAKELNVTKRTQIYSEIQNITYENAYYLWTDQPTNYHVERTWIKGYAYNPMYAGLYFYTYTKNV